MASIQNRLLSEMERKLDFEYHSGGAFVVHPPHSMGWRLLPFALTAQTDYPALLIVNGKRIATRGGEALYVGRSVRHHVSLVGNTAGYSRFSHFNLLLFGSIDVLAMFDVPSRFQGPAARHLGKINTRLSVLAGPDPDMKRMVERKSLGFELAQLLLEQGQPSVSGQRILGSLQRLEPVLRLINDHLADPITIANLAKQMHLSESRFHAVFKAIMGEAPLLYLQRLRLQSAQRLLIEADQPIKEICRLVGHNDVFHFSRLFRKRVGLSPSQYRKQARASLFAPHFAES